MSQPYIKQEPDENYYIQQGNHGQGQGHGHSGQGQGTVPTNLLSRAVLTRGFNSFDDPAASSMIDESDLLDLEGVNSPEVGSYSHLSSTGGHADAQSDPHALAAASIGFSSTPSRPILDSNLGTTPPVPLSTSPFDDFMFANARVQPSQASRQTSRPEQGLSPLRNSYSSRPDTFAQRFLKQEGGSGSSGIGIGGGSGGSGNPSGTGSINSAGSTPVGSYDHSYLAASPPVANSGAIAKSFDDKQQMMLAERRRRRRESHNAVERRRRDNINEKIRELSDLLPESFLLASNDVNAYNGTKDDRPNKGTVLSRSVDYIRRLQQVIDDQNRKELELHDMVQNLQRQNGLPVTEFTYTSAEAGLASLGLGPRAQGTQGAQIGSDNSQLDDELKAGGIPNIRSPDSVSSTNRGPGQSSTGITPDFTPDLDFEYYKQQHHNQDYGGSAIVDD